MAFKDEMLGNKPTADEKAESETENTTKSDKKQKSFIERNLGKILLGIACCAVGYLYMSDTSQPNNNNVAKTKEIKQEKTEQPQKPVTPEFQAESKESIDEKPKFSSSDWNKKIQSLFLTQPVIDLSREKPIIEFNNLDFFSTNKIIDLKDYDAVIRPSFFSVVNGDEIVANIEIASKNDDNIYIQKYFSLKREGFDPEFFDDCIIYKNNVYIVGEKILFFTIESIQQVKDKIRVVLSYNGQDIKLIKDAQL